MCRALQQIEAHDIVPSSVLEHVLERGPPPQDYFNQKSTLSEWNSTSVSGRKGQGERGSSTREHGGTRSRRRSYPEEFFIATPGTSKYRHDSSEENLHRGGQTPGPAPRQSRPSRLGSKLTDSGSDSDSSSTSSVSSVSDETAEVASSNNELSPIHARHLHRTADDDGHPLHSVSEHQRPRSSRDRSPNSQRYSYPSSSSHFGPQLSSSHDRRHQDVYVVTPNEERRGSATSQYANIPPPLPSGVSDSYFQIQPYSFVNRRGGPPRGNYRGANVRFGNQDEVLEYAEDRERRRRHSDDRRHRSQFVQSGGKDKVVSGVDGRRYVPDGVIWR